MPKPFTIVISSAGRRVGLVQAFRASAEFLNIELYIICTDKDPDLAPACHLADLALTVPSAKDSNFSEAIHAIASKYQPILFVPTIDPELSFYASSQLPCVSATSELVDIFYDKLKTAQFLEKQGLNHPKTCDFSENCLPLPYFLKPRFGSASKGAFLAETEKIPDLKEPYVAQELLDGDEFTVNLYFNKKGLCQCVIPHLRQEVRAGEVSKGLTVKNEVLEALGWKLGKILEGNVWGPLCFQTKYDKEGKFSIFEINPRFGGGYPLQHQAGAVFTQWLLEEALNLPSSAHNEWKANIQMLRYDEAIFKLS